MWQIYKKYTKSFEINNLYSFLSIYIHFEIGNDKKIVIEINNNNNNISFKINKIELF